MGNRFDGLYVNGEARHAGVIHSYSVENSNAVGDIVNSHEGWEILFSDRSIPNLGVEIEVRGKRFRVGSDSVFVYNGYEEHHEFYGRPNSNIKALLLRESFINDRLGGEASAADFSFLDVESKSQTFSRFARSVFESLRDTEVTVNEATAMADALVLDMIDSLRHDRPSVKKKLEATAQSEFLFKDAISILHEAVPDAEFDLASLSASLGVTKFHVIRTIKRKTGLTPYRYLADLRLERARRELRKAKKSSVADVAMSCGWEDLSSFNKAFRKRFGSSPAANRT